MMRTHAAGTLRKEHVGENVTLAGWIARRRDHGGVAFIDLRDASGICQIVVRDEYLDKAGIHDLRNEFCIQVTGVVDARDGANINPNIPTGEVEVAIRELVVLNPAAPLPFQIDEHSGVGEDARLKYRYLDLRRQRQHEALVLRSNVTKTVRDALARHNFYDIETPTLTRSTPEGARDFVVPARLHPGCWYALPQSPQLFKQLLMVAGMERYYQIARCYRDEDFRADRQPEFTQIDVEMSFVDQDDVLAVAEDVMRDVWRLIDVEIPSPMPRMTWHDAMNNYGSDKPDLRFENTIVEVTPIFANTDFRVFQNEYVGAVVMPGGGSQPRRQFDAWQEWAKQRGARGLAYITVAEDGELAGPVAKNISDAEKAAVVEATGAKPGDCIFFASGGRKTSQELLGATRLEIGKRCNLIAENSWSFVWIIDAPMFKAASEARAEGDVAVGGGSWTAVHHAFTSPKPECLDTFDTDPSSALSYGYDFVCNGVEVGGGSIRIHQRSVQERVFKVMGLSQEEAQEKFGFLLDAFAFGAPPHGGIAWGLDRLVMLLGGFDTIRDVIAFPKSGGGFDPLTEAPAPITAQQRKEAGVDSKLAEKKSEGAEATKPELA